jgi:hypothetical protein
MQFDFKLTVWERITVDPKDEKKILELIKSGEITCASDIYNYVEDASRELLPETETAITPEDCNGYCTIDVIGDNGESLFANGYK